MCLYQYFYFHLGVGIVDKLQKQAVTECVPRSFKRVNIDLAKLKFRYCFNFEDKLWVMMTESSTLWLKFWLDLESKVWTKDSTLKSGPKNYQCVLCQKAGKRPLSPSGENYNWQTDLIDLLYCKKRQKHINIITCNEIMSFSCDYFVFVILLYTE